jgi:hypothetical protein
MLSKVKRVLCLALLLRIRKAPGSDLGVETVYPVCGLYGFTQSFRYKPGYYLKLGHDRFLPYLFQFIVQ